MLYVYKLVANFASLSLGAVKVGQSGSVLMRIVRVSKNIKSAALTKTVS